MKDLEHAIEELLTKIKTKKQLKLDLKENWVKVEYNSQTENKYTTNATKKIKQAKGIYI